jgi:hypothetical protein
VVAALVMGSGCTMTVRGAPAEAPNTTTKPIAVPTTTPRPPVTEDGAAWAAANLAPCAVLSQPGLAPLLTSTPAMDPPDPDDDPTCAADVRLPDGTQSWASARVAVEFTHNDRIDAARVEVGGLAAYRLRRDGTSIFDQTKAQSRCQVDIPLSPTRSVRLRSASDGLEASCVIAGIAAEGAAGLLKDAGKGFAAGTPDENLDPECQAVPNADESCRAARIVEVPEGIDAILNVPDELRGDVACSMLRDALMEVVGRNVELAVRDSNCVARTVDGTLTIDLATFAWARLEQYCYSDPADREPIKLSGHDAIVCGQNYGGHRYVYAAAFDNPRTNGVLLGEVQLSFPRGLQPDKGMFPTDDRVLLLDRTMEKVLAKHFSE